MAQSMAKIDGTILLTEDHFKSNVMESNDMWLVLFVDPTKGSCLKSQLSKEEIF